MKPVDTMSQAELGAYVQSHLGEKGIDVVLSGGAAVAIYTSGKYVSRGLDLVNRYSVKHSIISAAIQELGFTQKGRQFVHPDSEFIVEFPPGPLSIGEELIRNIDELDTAAGILRVISPTDCVKDRLSWYYHFGDIQCLSQAILVSKDHRIDIEDIRRWSETEGKLDDFEEIRHQLEGS